MATDRVINLPVPLSSAPNFLPPNVYYFTTNRLGFQPIEDTNYSLIDPPSDLSGYAIANVQDFYLTPSPQYIIPLFLHLPAVFFSEFDTYHQVTAYDQFRLDLISYRYYLTPEYWWIIAAANDILDPFALEVGTILRIPSDNIVVNDWLQSPVKKVREAGTFFFGTL
jgi:hypothetical protein